MTEKTIEEIIVGGKEAVDINGRRLRDSQHDDSAEQERQAVEEQLRRVIHCLCTGEDCRNDFKLVVEATAAEAASTTPASQTQQPQAAPADGVHRLRLCGSEIVYCTGGREFRRFSPMVARLAPHCAHELAAGPAAEADVQAAADGAASRGHD